MGEHKHNPTAIAAKEGKLPPKSPKIGKREQERLLLAAMDDVIRERVGISPSDFLDLVNSQNSFSEFYKEKK